MVNDNRDGSILAANACAALAFARSRCYEWQPMERTESPHTASTTARDGTVLGWEVVGSGPPLLVLHGGGRAGIHYRVLASHLASSFTVLLLDRRGRGLTASPPCGDLATHLEDIAEVMKATGARWLFGHSAGAVLALETARRLPVDALAVYEPPMVDETNFQTDWIPDFEAALDAGHAGRALILLARGLQMGPPEWMPDAMLNAGAWLGGLTRGAKGEELLRELRTVPYELAMAKGCHSAGYADVKARTLLMYGTASPPFLQQSKDLVARAMPHVELAAFPGQAHNAPDLTGPKLIAQALQSFFGKTDPASAN